ncbi:MAG: methionine--tRNA ligase [Candidatus Cloacimonetes bacterium]|nr:methionine--tRNA ligase [Candidatus Cloacimonadota bacterium]
MSNKDSFYITTPIYYVNDNPHIGTAYVTLICDTLSRFHRLFPKSVRFTTGCDEHGQKVQDSATKLNRTPQEHVDIMSKNFETIWEDLGIEHDDFIRTTQDRHKKVVNHLFTKLMKSGMVYKGKYQGAYCTPCETFVTQSKAEDNKCPDCSRDLILVEEDNYFLKLSAFTDKLQKHYDENPDFVQPSYRKNEMLAMLKAGLDDISISRDSVSWGIPIPGDSEHVIYVWIEALMNYVTSAGYLSDDKLFETFWPATCQVVGKDILKFHAITWPAVLMAVGLPLPQTILAHGFILADGEKMSKSKGNAVSPTDLVSKYGKDALRFSLFREISLGQDGSYSEESLIKRYNSELANDLGNLSQRVLAMVVKNLGGTLNQPAEIDTETLAQFDKAKSEYKDYFENYKLNQGIESLWTYVNYLNKFVDQSKPWALAKEEKFEQLNTVLYTVADSLKALAHLLSPVLPDTCVKILNNLNFDEDFSWDSACLKQIPSDHTINKAIPLFPRIEQSKAQKQNQQKKPKKQAKNLIDIEDFQKIKMELVSILEAKKHPEADKLLVLQLSTSQGKKQVVSGISNYYEPDSLIGKQVVFVKNLKPCELRGVLSEGMVLAASNKKELSLVSVDQKIQEGSKVS